MKIEALTAERAEEYRKEIAELYYENVRSNAFLEHYTYKEAYEKIASLINHLKDNTAVVYGAFYDEKIVGFIWAYLHQFREENRMYVGEIRVNEKYRGCGIGSRLLKLVEDRAKEKRLGAIYLHAEANNPDAIRFYETNGYEKERIQLRKEIIDDDCFYENDDVLKH